MKFCFWRMYRSFKHDGRKHIRSYHNHPGRVIYKFWWKIYLLINGTQIRTRSVHLPSCGSRRESYLNSLLKAIMNWMQERFGCCCAIENVPINWRFGISTLEPSKPGHPKPESFFLKLSIGKKISSGKTA